MTVGDSLSPGGRNRASLTSGCFSDLRKHLFSVAADSGIGIKGQQWLLERGICLGLVSRGFGFVALGHFGFRRSP